MWRALFLVCLLAGPVSAETAPEWNPQKTWVFAVGVIKFDDPSVTTYPQKGRVDAEMMAAYTQRGVPADHMVFLKDEAATKEHIVEQLKAALAKTGPDDTLIFYYAGHGSRNYKNPARPVAFLTYDTATKLPLKELLDVITSDFKGKRVLLTADCCYSGGLAEEVNRHQSPIAFAALTSSQATSTSTGAWTFTQALTDMLKGNRRIDLNHDGEITLREAASYINTEMAFGEGQLSSFSSSKGFPVNLGMAPASGAAVSTETGTHCEGLYEGKWYKVTILKTEGNRSFVTWAGWNHSEDSWLNASDLRPYAPKLLPVGTSVDILWEKKWYPGTVLRNQLGLQQVHYDGYEAIDDEWVTPTRLKAR